MGALMEEVAKSDTLLAGEGLKPSAAGARITRSGTRRTVIDGPFSETKELIAGYSIIQVRSKEEAIAFARRWLRIHAETGGLAESAIAIRQIFELSEIPSASAEQGAEKRDGWRQRELRLRQRIGQ
jgi:hypothetical protein